MNKAHEPYGESRGTTNVVEKTRRAQERVAIPQETVRLEIDGKPSQFAAIACDVGIKSAGIISQIPIKVDSHVRICWKNDGEQWYKAMVVHCTGSFGGYKLGLIMAED